MATKLSIIVPSRNERFLAPTVKDLLAKAEGDVELIAVLDGYWAHDLPTDKRLRMLHRGTALGMRPAINSAIQMATGTHVLKCDAHTLWDQGYDVKLLKDYHEDNWILVPRRYALDPEAWAWDTSNPKYPVDYHSLSEPFGKYGDSVPGLHGTAWTARREARKHITIDEELASQGSAWFMSRKHWDRVGPLRSNLYGCFWFENQELALTTWLMGGAQMVTKNTWYAHLYKGARWGRGYSTRDMGHEAATAYTSWFFVTDQPFAGKVLTFRSLIEHFAPVPTWTDIDAIFRRARDEFRNPYAVAA
jgi:glycosyltransferase involved in cell wall biosynthesis